MAAQLCRFSLIAAFVLFLPVAGAQAPPAPFGESVPLSAAELQQITLDLLERYPQLAASPGIKANGTSVEGGPGSVVGTSIVFYPHAEDHGIKEAFEAHCSRAYPIKTWTCDAQIRRYIQLATQDWEVRVRGDIASDAALALIEASRRDLQATVANAPAIASTAIIMGPYRGNAYYVSWGTPDGLWRVKMVGELELNGDATSPEDWHTTRLP